MPTCACELANQILKIEHPAARNMEKCGKKAQQEGPCLKKSLLSRLCYMVPDTDSDEMTKFAQSLRLAYELPCG